MILGALLVARDVAGLLGKSISEINRARLRWIVLAILLGVTLSHENRKVKRFDLFNFGPHDIVHYTPAQWADQKIPSHSLVAAKEMSGELGFYTQRPIVRWDLLETKNWPTVKKHGAERGYQWYALLLPWEVADAQKKMGGRWTKMGMLDQVTLWQVDLTPN
jgi:hypothetical protein